MVVVRVELWPGGDRSKARLLGEARIANDGGQRTDSRGDYTVELSKFNGTGVWKRGRVTGFPRLRLGGWDLLFRALRATVGARNPDEGGR